MSNRARRRAIRQRLAQRRDTLQHGTADRAAARPATPAYVAARNFRAMLPDVARPVAKATVPVHSVTILQTLTARGTGKYTRGKRRVRYRAVSDWRGHRLAPKP